MTEMETEDAEIHVQDPAQLAEEVIEDVAILEIGEDQGLTQEMPEEEGQATVLTVRDDLTETTKEEPVQATHPREETQEREMSQLSLNCEELISYS